MTLEEAKELIDLESKLRIELIVLARHLSLAGRIEMELVRTMRLRVLPSSDAGLEADLYFSSLLQTRGVDAFSLIPEIRSQLQVQLGRHRDELDLAHAVLEEAHAALDEVVLIEERATYFSLRGDRAALLAMQRELGSVVRELRPASSATPTANAGLLRWAARVWPRLPERLRHSEAGSALNQLTLGGLSRLGDPSAKQSPLPSASDFLIETSTVDIGFEVHRSGAMLSFPPRPGALVIRLRGSDAVRCEIDVPHDDGWMTYSVELNAEHPKVSLSIPPSPLVILRGDNGDEYRLRPVGLFPNPRPRLRVIRPRPHADPSPAVAAEIDELDWVIVQSNRSTQPRIFLSWRHLAGDQDQANATESLRSRLLAAGYDVWLGEDPSGEKTRKAIAQCQAAVVLLSRGGPSHGFQREELSLLFRHQDQVADFPILPVLRDESPLRRPEQHDLLALRFLEIQHIPLDNPDVQAEAIVKTLHARDIKGQANCANQDAVLIEFERLDDLQAAFPTGGTEEKSSAHVPARPWPRPPVLEVRSGLPWLVRVGGFLHHVEAQAHPDGPSDNSQAEQADPFTTALQSASLAVSRADRALLQPQDVNCMAFRESFKASLLAIEREALDRWLAKRQSPSSIPRIPTKDPVHAMVFILYDRWRPKGETGPLRTFDSYRSSQQRLVNLVGQDGTLWVVTRVPGDGPPRYRIAYRLCRAHQVKPSSRDLRVGKHYLVRARSGDDVTQFSDHDATDVILSLQFVTGQPVKSSGGIGLRLRSIPQLTTDDVERLEGFVRQFTSRDRTLSEPAKRTGPDEPLAESGSWDHTLKVWEMGSGRELRTLIGHSSSVTAVALSSAARLAVSGSEDGTLKVWELESGRELRTLIGHSDGVKAVALSADGRLGVSGSEDRTVKIWELGSGRELLTLAGHSNWVNAVALSADGRLAVSASMDRTLKVWELESGRELRTLLTGDRGAVNAVALSADGRLAVSASKDPILRVWDLESGRELRTLTGHSDEVRAVALSSDGRLAVSTSRDQTLRVWELASGRELRALTGHRDEVTAVALSPDGRLAVSTSRDQTLKVWELASGQVLATFDKIGAVTACALASDGRTIISGDAAGRVHLLRLVLPDDLADVNKMEKRRSFAPAKRHMVKPTSSKSELPPASIRHAAKRNPRDHQPPPKYLKP